MSCKKHPAKKRARNKPKTSALKRLDDQVGKVRGYISSSSSSNSDGNSSSISSSNSGKISNDGKRGGSN